MKQMFQQKWATLPVKQKRIAVIVGALCLLVGGIAIFQQEPAKRERPYDKKTDQVHNVMTDRASRNMGLDALSGKLKDLNKENEELTKQIQRLEAKNRDKTEFKAMEERFNQKIEALTKELEAVKGIQVEGHQAALGSNGQISLQPNPFADGAQEAIEAQAKRNKHTGPMIRVFSEEDQEDRAKDKSKKAIKNVPADSEAYIPAGSIITGTILSGGDFPTNKGGFDNPTPLLIRISKHAILPNRFKTDIRECFLLTGGRGDLSSERVKLRGETLSCVRDDGSVIEAKLNSYVTGEDGKEGVKGRLVSKQGQLIARSLVSGFASGLSEVFDVNAVPTVTTSSDGSVEYQSVYSSDAMQGAAVKGFSNAMERISDFYLEMAKDIFPVVEINAGRQVDIVVISGTRLKVSAESVNGNKKEITHE